MAGKAKLGGLISATKCVQIGDQNKEWLLQENYKYEPAQCPRSHASDQKTYYFT